jgi:hypothetical protein
MTSVTIDLPSSVPAAVALLQIRIRLMLVFRYEPDICMCVDSVLPN